MRVCRGKEEQGRVPEAKWDRGTASSNQIVLLIGDTATGGAGLAETPVIVSPSQTSKKKPHTLGFFCPAILSASAAISHPSTSVILRRPFRLPTNATHISPVSRPEEINSYFLKDSGN